MTHDDACAGPFASQPQRDLPLPDPYPEYVTCPACGEPEVETWCYDSSVRCHQCGQLIPHRRAPCFGSSPFCREKYEQERRARSAPSGSAGAGVPGR
jgi:hypothetical protein